MKDIETARRFVQQDHAFPSVIKELDVVDPGMTLLDYFAAQAMNTIIGNYRNALQNAGDLASRSYLIAEAMMAERTKWAE